MKQIVTLLPALMFLLPLYSIAQQTGDSFEDGNLTDNPTWTGDLSSFRVNGQFQLQSSGNVTSPAELALPLEPCSTCEWRFWLKAAFNPSSQNQIRFYLQADSSKPSASISAFYLQFGGSSGNTDSICLYLQETDRRTPVIMGRPSTFGKSSNSVRVKVTRNLLGEWELLTDTNVTGNWISEGKWTDTISLISGYQGIWFQHTSTNSTNLYFDDFTQYSNPTTNTTLTLEELFAESSNRIRIRFSNPVPSLSASSFLCSNNNKVTTITARSGSKDILLTLVNPLETGKIFQMQISGIKDSWGNSLTDTLALITYSPPAKESILITEILPDPTPAVGLPEAEFIELYNHSSEMAIGEQLFLVKDKLTYSLDGLRLAPNEYVIVCKTTDTSLFKPYGNIFPLKAFTGLPNESGILEIRNSDSMLISSFSYTDKTYKSDEKKDGGWSIELINPNQICKGDLNLTASKALTGGTPGALNSNWDTSFDTLPPKIIKTEFWRKDTLVFILNESVDTSISKHIEIRIDTLILRETGFYKGSLNRVYAHLSIPLQNKSVVQTNISGIYDCSGNTDEQTYSFYYSTPVDAGFNSLIISEIYYNVTDKCSSADGEFIEVYNRSNGVINLKDFKLRDLNSNCTLPEFPVYPDSFVVLTSASTNLPTTNESLIIRIPGFPALNSNEHLEIRNPANALVHEVSYKDEDYRSSFNMLNSSFSIERIDYSQPCTNRLNFTPSIAPGGMTPGYGTTAKLYPTDLNSPELIDIFWRLPDGIILTFTEAVDSSRIKLLPQQTPEAVNIKSIRYASPELEKIELITEPQFDTFVHQRLVSFEIEDCVGNLLKQDAMTFSYPFNPKPGELQINEILFNPEPGGSDFIELINTGTNTLSLNEIELRNADPAGIISEPYQVELTNRTIKPSEVIALTDNPEYLIHRYPDNSPVHIHQNSIPPMNDDQGTVILYSLNSETDRLSYTEKMHFPLLTNVEGISLERIEMVSETEKFITWHSSPVLASPGLTNDIATIADYKSPFYCETKVFSPDLDGYEDVMLFRCNTDTRDKILKIVICNGEGFAIRTIYRDVPVSGTILVEWDGIADNGQAAPAGIYNATLTETYANGETSKFRSAFGLTLSSRK